MAIFFALLTFFAWGCSGIFGALSSKKIGGTKALFWQLLFALIATTFYIPFAPTFGQNISSIIIGIILAIVNVFAFLFYYKSLEIGKVTLIGSIVGSFPVLSTFFSVIFFQEKLQIWQIVAIICTFSGLLIVLFPIDEIKQVELTTIKKDKSFLFAFITMVLWATFGTFIKIPVLVIGWFWPIYFFLILGTIALFFYNRLNKVVISLPKKNHILLIIILATLCETGGQFSYNLGVSYGFVSLVAPIAGSWPVFFVLLSKIVFKEKITHQQTLGVVFTLGYLSIEFCFCIVESFCLLCSTKNLLILIKMRSRYNTSLSTLLLNNIRRSLLYAKQYYFLFNYA